MKYATKCRTFLGPIFIISFLFVDCFGKIPILSSNVTRNFVSVPWIWNLLIQPIVKFIRTFMQNVQNRFENLIFIWYYNQIQLDSTPIWYQIYLKINVNTKSNFELIHNTSCKINLMTRMTILASNGKNTISRRGGEKLIRLWLKSLLGRTLELHQLHLYRLLNIRSNKSRKTYKHEYY